MKKLQKLILMFVCAAVVCSATACGTNTNNDATENGVAADTKDGKTAGEDLKEGAKDVGDAVKHAGDAVKNGVEDVGDHMTESEKEKIDQNAANPQQHMDGTETQK